MLPPVYKDWQQLRLQTLPGAEGTQGCQAAGEHEWAPPRGEHLALQQSDRREALCPAMPPPGVRPPEILAPVNREGSVRVFIAALSITIKNQK